MADESCVREFHHSDVGQDSAGADHFASAVLFSPMRPGFFYDVSSKSHSCHFAASQRIQQRDRMRASYWILHCRLLRPRWKSGWILRRAQNDNYFEYTLISITVLS
jgi:hypothetical protein